MKILLSDLETLRGRIFFWLGLLILPVFWVWWMRPTHFGPSQRMAGGIWTGIYIALILVFWGELILRFGHLGVTYPAVAIRMGLVLGLWLLMRKQGIFGGLVCAALIGECTVIPLSLMARKTEAFIQSPCLLLFPLLIAGLHLLDWRGWGHRKHIRPQLPT